MESRNKVIWIFNHYATKPDEPASRDFDLFRQLAIKGYKPTIFASSFSHYKLKIKYLEKRENWKIEELDGVRFVWIRTFPYQRNNWKRFLNMFSYAWRVYWIARKMNEKPDVIIGTCVHPFAVLSAYIVAKKKKSKFFFMVRDLWPQTLIDIGYIKENNPIVFLLRVLEKFLFKRADKIIIVSKFFADYITGLGFKKENIYWIPNGLDFSSYENIKEYDGGNTQNFNFMYTGIHARYSNLDVVIKAAKILEEKGKTNIKFTLVGDGLEKKNLINLAKDLNVKNVEFVDLVPKSKMPEVLSQADAFISIIREMPVVEKFGVSSNKINDYMAAGRPIIFAVKSRNNPIEEAKAGISILPGDAEKMALACEKMASLSSEERVRMGNNGMQYVRNNFDIKIISQKMEEIIA